MVFGFVIACIQLYAIHQIEKSNSYRITLSEIKLFGLSIVLFLVMLILVNN
jgi:hypothetical protein